MSLRDDPEMTAASAGVLAVSSAMVSKYAKRRHPTLGALPPAFLPAALADAPRLLDVDDARPDLKMARITAASLAYSLEATKEDGGAVLPGGYTRRILRRTEAPPESQSGSAFCHYCELFYAMRGADSPPFEVVHHGARIESDFDPSDTNIAKAGISNYQLFLTKAMALEILQRSHPLHWKTGASDLFDRTNPAKLDGQKPRQKWKENQDPNAIVGWEQRAKVKEFLYENATWPWNEDFSTRVENVLAISEFDNIDEHYLRRVSFKYSLESCLRSDYGLVVEELRGLDIDDGGYDGHALPAEIITGESEGDDRKYLDHLKVADLRHLAERIGVGHVELHQHDEELDEPEATVRRKQKAAVVRAVAAKLGHEWGEPAWLLTISASKRLRYTVPQYAPIELWATLTWMAPALLFVFINRAVCQIPHTISAPARQPADDRRTGGLNDE